jgi:hypothetical protein
MDPGGTPAATEEPGGAVVDGEWRSQARRLTLDGTHFCVDGDLCWLDAQRCDALLPLASLAECGHASCACSRVQFPSTRKRFREELVRRVAAAVELQALPSNIVYVGLGSGLLLGDLDVMMGLQEAGVTIEEAAFIDTDYREHCHSALAEVASYLSPARVVAFSSAADYAAARLRGLQPAAHCFVQIDVAELALTESLTLSTVALAKDGLGFVLANRHHSTLVPMVSWRRVGGPLAATAAAAAEALSPPALYTRLLALDPSPLIALDREPVSCGGHISAGTAPSAPPVGGDAAEWAPRAAAVMAARALEVITPGSGGRCSAEEGLRAAWLAWQDCGGYDGQPPIHSKCVGFAQPGGGYHAVYLMDRTALARGEYAYGSDLVLGWPRSEDGEFRAYLPSAVDGDGDWATTSVGAGGGARHIYAWHGEYQVETRPWYRHALAGPTGGSWTSPYADPVTGELLVSFVAPLPQGAGVVIAGAFSVIGTCDDRD